MWCRQRPSKPFLLKASYSKTVKSRSLLLLSLSIRFEWCILILGHVTLRLRDLMATFVSMATDLTLTFWYLHMQISICIDEWVSTYQYCWWIVQKLFAKTKSHVVQCRYFDYFGPCDVIYDLAWRRPKQDSCPLVSNPVYFLSLACFVLEMKSLRNRLSKIISGTDKPLQMPVTEHFHKKVEFPITLALYKIYVLANKTYNA